MTVTASVQVEDNYGNKYYFILEKGRWSVMHASGIPYALSNFSSNSAEFYIALANCESKSEAIMVINKHGNYLKKGSAK
jgi:hypothetical protein